MSSFNMLFIINSNKELEVNKPEVKKIIEYKSLFDRDKLSGEKKGVIACAEIYYIYLVHDIRSLYYNLPIEEKKIKAKKDAKLPEKWKEDEKIEDAVIRYKEDLKLTAAGNAYVVAEKAYYVMAEDTNTMLDNVLKLKQEAQKRLSKIESSVSMGDMEFASTVNEYLAISSSITKVQKEMRENIKDFKNMGQAVKDLALKFTEEGGNLKTPVGGGEINPREE